MIIEDIEHDVKLVWCKYPVLRCFFYVLLFLLSLVHCVNQTISVIKDLI